MVSVHSTTCVTNRSFWLWHYGLSKSMNAANCSQLVDAILVCPLFLKTYKSSITLRFYFMWAWLVLVFAKYYEYILKQSKIVIFLSSRHSEFILKLFKIFSCFSSKDAANLFKKLFLIFFIFSRCHKFIWIIFWISSSLSSRIAMN